MASALQDQPDPPYVMRIQVDGKQYQNGRKILDRIRFDLHAGSVTSLLGPSGAGKTTLLRIIAGLDTDFDGSICGQDGLPYPRIRLLFQDGRLLPWLRVGENIAFGLESARACHSRSDIHELARRVGLSNETLQMWPRQLSGGMRRRVAFACALASSPEVLLLDEPFSSIDGASRVSLHELLTSFCEGSFSSQPPAVLLVTHDIVEAAQLSSRVIVLSPDRPAVVLHEISLNPPSPRFLHDPREITNRVELLLPLLISSSRSNV